MFEVLEHAADVGFRARAASLRAMFECAAEALVELAMETGNIETRESYPVEAEGDSNESLLVNWLSEILFYLDGRRLAMRRFQVSDLTPDRVRGVALGEPRDPSRHAARLVIKGVTYHQLKIEQIADGWICEVFLDV
jgi:SHS2 domain-containing protein